MGALSQLKVLDFSTLLPGPYATMMLADLGADVLRVESPTRTDLTRVIPPKVGKDSAAHASLNRNKRAISLDLKSSEAKKIIEQLVAEYDIVLEQFRPGVMDRLGFGYESLKAINPQLIYCAISGYGQTGPYRDRAGHDNNYLSVSGVNDLSRRKGDAPTPLGIQVADVAGGSMHAVVGILAAVQHRQQTGEGQFIDISMTDAAFSLATLFGSGALATGRDIEPESTLLNGGGYYDYYLTRDGRSFSVGSLEPQFLAQLVEVIGGEGTAELAVAQDPESQARFKALLKETFASKDFAEWREIFAEKDACVEPVLSFLEACEHPQLKARQMVVDVPLSSAEGHLTQRATKRATQNATQNVAQIASPIKLSETPAAYNYSGVPLGTDNQVVLESLGYSQEEIDNLIEKGVVGKTA